MDRLMHNQVIRLPTGPLAGIYRIVLDEPSRDRTAAVRIADGVVASKGDSSSKGHGIANKQPQRRRPPPLVGKLIWFDRRDLVALEQASDLIRVEVEPEAIYLAPLTGSPKAKALFERRKQAMADFLDFDCLTEGILVHDGLGGLVREAMRRASVSRHFVYNCWSLLCRFGISEFSLRPRLDRCGAPGVSRPCDPNGRQKPGRKTNAQKFAALAGNAPPPTQPAMNTKWRLSIIAADKAIPTPKPAMPARCAAIMSSHFVRHFRYEGDQLVEVDLKKGEYPTTKQIRRVLEVDTSRLQRLLQKTTTGHYQRSLRGAASRSWKGVAGPGHTWAIDSTIGDIYLRSSLNRAWIIGRPIVYIIVDVWSTAIVGFYVCLEGPSWAMAKLALLSAGADPTFIANLWGYQPVLSLAPAPTLCAFLLCDRGEYLSQAARRSGIALALHQSYAPPYRPDLKGIVEVLHRIAKDQQYHFLPGAIDARRKEYELRRFNPASACLTVREYVHYLHFAFAEYNLTADRSHRLDAHMRASGVFPSPAGLWRWGHDIGIGFRKDVPKAELLSELLPSATARVTRSGIQFGHQTYGNPDIAKRNWISEARNFGGWDLPCHYFPGTVQMIWAPDIGGTGMLELEISDQSRASPELTFDEVADSIMYSTCNRSDIDHQNTLMRLKLQQQNKDIKGRAMELTAEAIARDQGTKPTLTESRQLEIASSSQNLVPPVTLSSTPGASPMVDETDQAYLTMMQEILGPSDDNVDSNETR